MIMYMSFSSLVIRLRSFKTNLFSFFRTKKQCMPLIIIATKNYNDQDTQTVGESLPNNSLYEFLNHMI